jgi:hypothetical protein
MILALGDAIPGALCSPPRWHGSARDASGGRALLGGMLLHDAFCGGAPIGDVLWCAVLAGALMFQIGVGRKSHVEQWEALGVRRGSPFHTQAGLGQWACRLRC